MSKKNPIRKRNKSYNSYDDDQKMEPPPTKRRMSKRSRRHRENNLLRDFRNGSLDVTEIDEYFDTN